MFFLSQRPFYRFQALVFGDCPLAEIPRRPCVGHDSDYDLAAFDPDHDLKSVAVPW